MIATDFVFSDSEYMMIVGEYIAGRKTPIFYIGERRGSGLGEIRWYAPWRSFCFFTYADKVFDNGCLAKILEWVNAANDQWKHRSAGNRDH